VRRAGSAVAAGLAALVVAGCGGGGAATTAAASSARATGTGAGTGTAAVRTASTSSMSTIQLTAPSDTSTSSSAPARTTSTSATPASTSAPSGGAGLAAGFGLSSPAFSSGGAIPSQYTCDGQDISPPLQWSGVPAGTKELVLVIRDPDASTADFVHWAVAGIAPSATGFPAGGVGGQVIPGRNSFGSLGYRGPCPPTGGTPHHYVFTLSALASASGLRPGFSADEIQSQALGIATLTATYARR